MNCTVCDRVLQIAVSKRTHAFYCSVSCRLTAQLQKRYSHSHLDMSWIGSAACKGANPETFFPPNEIERGRQPVDMYTYARSICKSCTVTDECLQYAIEARINDGMWGGLTSQERRRLQRKRRTA